MRRVQILLFKCPAKSESLITTHLTKQWKTTRCSFVPARAPLDVLRMPPAQITNSEKRNGVQIALITANFGGSVPSLHQRACLKVPLARHCHKFAKMEPDLSS